MSGLAAVAHADVSSIDPASAETTPGGTATATVTVDSGILLTCLAATSDGGFLVTFNGSPTFCSSGVWFATMEVTVPALTEPGMYTVTVQEVDLLGSLLASYPWPLLVIALDTTSTTTTTLLPDLTLVPTTTTTTTTTTTLATATTTTLGASTTSDNLETTEADDDSGDVASVGSSTTSSTPTGALEQPPERDQGILAAGEPQESDGDKPFSEIAVTSGLIDLADRALPPVFAQAVMSPLLLFEVLLRALARTSAGLLLPLALTVALGLGLALRLRRDATELPSLDDLIEIPVEDTTEEPG